jgi:hypothetical protein
MPAHQAALAHAREAPALASQRQPRRRGGRPERGSGNTNGRIIRRVMLGIALQPSISASASLVWQPGRIHQLAKMRLIDLIALYQSMLPGKGGEHDQAAQTAAGGWTKDQVITAIRNLEAPYEDVGGWQRAMKIIAAEPTDGVSAIPAR